MNANGWMERVRLRRLGAVALLFAACSQPMDSSPGKGSEVGSSRQAIGIGKPGGWLKGRATASYRSLPAKTTIGLADATIFAQNAQTGVNTSSVQADFVGGYSILVKPGKYKICWSKPGFVTGCSANVYTVVAGDVFTGYQPLRVEGDRVLHGRVELNDGSRCFSVDKFHGVEIVAKVEILNAASAVLRSTRVNHDAVFVLPVDSTARFVRARCGQAIKTIDLATTQPPPDYKGVVQFKVVVQNKRPIIAPLTATASGSDVRRGIAPSSIVELSAPATDPDGNSLGYAWKLPSNAGSLTNAHTAAPTWKLPDRDGTFDAYVAVNDGLGGFVSRSVSVRVRSKAVTLFSGNVRDDGGGVVDKATVSVGALSVNTDARGHFSLSVPEARAYLMNITKQGYAEYSRRLIYAATGQKFVLTKTHRQDFLPTADAIIEDKRRAWLQPPCKQTQECRPRRGGRVLLPANSLKLVPTPVLPLTAHVVTYDPTTETIPGDMGAVDSTGNETVLTSYGAMFVEIRDQVGTVYNLDSGKTAIVQVPLQDNVIAQDAPAAKIKSWFYDLARGTWADWGALGVKNGNYYDLKVTHFSTQNADIEHNNPSCMRVHLNGSYAANPNNYTARLDVVPTASGTAARRFDLVLDDTINTFYNLPNNTQPNDNFTLQIIDTSVVPNVTKKTVAGSTGPAWGGKGVPPASATCVIVEIADDGVGDTSDTFLYRRQAGDASWAVAYNAAIDPLIADNPADPASVPRRRRQTLGDFWLTNGFGADGTAGGALDATHRTYFINNNDLGFGRDMYCNPSGANVACYVSNYGGPDQTPGNFDAAQARDRSLVKKTVAMEYSPVEGEPTGTRIVKFYIYDGGQATAPLGTNADLDGGGPKEAPMLCTHCHGGVYLPANPLAPLFADLNMGSSFREFDFPSYRDGTVEPGDLPNDLASGLLDVKAQHTAFYNQNMRVKASAPAPKVTELIDAFYPTNAEPFVENAVVPGWTNSVTGGAGVTSTEDLYLKVITACRTCHVAVGSGTNTNGMPSWSTYTEFASYFGTGPYAGVVCGQYRDMPHAVVTFNNFWLMGGAEKLATFTGPGATWPSAIGCDPNP